MSDAVIVVVDDDPRISATLLSALAETGLEARAFADGEGALDYLAGGSETPACIVTDINMPGMSGWEFAKRARLLLPRLGVVYISSECMDDWRLKAVADSHFLPKPFVRDQLFRAIAALI
ncbi:response regulator [Rhizorhabdus wittichii]|uniref:response regulator n=1 Tax=Rhizorhabdus wittichii TaxID=160791 RepID=UPI0002F1C226|nr:response regulator [Rhizorhabdus wittichii]ARR56859.1 response regulator [Rhizorhabdus wittichii DC-6]